MEAAVRVIRAICSIVSHPYVVLDLKVFSLTPSPFSLTVQAFKQKLAWHEYTYCLCCSVIFNTGRGLFSGCDYDIIQRLRETLWWYIFPQSFTHTCSFTRAFLSITTLPVPWSNMITTISLHPLCHSISGPLGNEREQWYSSHGSSATFWT